MLKDQRIADQAFIPVILGGNLGAYSIARSFHEAYGTKSITISRLITGPISHSSILQTVVEGNMEQEESLLASLNRIDFTYPSVPKMLIGSDDWHVEIITGLRPKLGANWTIPYSSQEVISYVTKKANFYALCEKLGVDYPKTLVFSDMSASDLHLPFDFPVVVKPTNSITYQALSFTGKRKVYIVDTREEFEEAISLIRGGGYLEDIIIQEFIPGDDTSMHVLTCYTTREGKTIMSSLGQTLVEDHTPTGAGNHLAIRTLINEEVAEKAARLIEHVGYVGFSNYDLKYDSRDGKYKFFEMNARLGRSNYYVTAAGNNVARYYIEDYFHNSEINISPSQKEVLYSIIPKKLLLKNIKQEQLRTAVENLYHAKQVQHPLKYRPIEKNLKRRFYETASTQKFYLKFKKYPPHQEVVERV